jgi:hypothetical protein
VNAGYLGLSPSRYAALEAKLNSKASADDEREQVIGTWNGSRSRSRANNLNNARMENGFLGEKITGAPQQYPMPFEWVRLNKDYELLSSKYERKTDSLCDVAMALSA